MSSFGVYLKKSELILRAIGSAGGIPPAPLRPSRLACPTEAVRRREAEVKRTILSFSKIPNKYNYDYRN